MIDVEAQEDTPVSSCCMNCEECPLQLSLEDCRPEYATNPFL